MTHYRLYTLDGRTDGINAAEDFEAEDDAGANREAARRQKLAGLEMWSGRRKVARLEAKPGAR